MKTTNDKNTNLKNFCALWKRKSKNGKPYFTGKTEAGGLIIAFYNTNKKDLKEPDLRVYSRDEEGNTDKEEYFALWCNSTKDGKKKYLSGKVSGKRVVGFFNEKFREGSKLPYITIHFSEEASTEPKKEAPTGPKGYEVPNQKPAKGEQTDFEELPF